MKCGDIHAGLNIKELRLLSYQFAVHLGIVIPNRWSQNQEAGRDWFNSFMERNIAIAIAIAESEPPAIENAIASLGQPIVMNING